MNNKAGIYIRLSQMDDYMQERFESESVENQRVILNDYAISHNFNVIKEYVDDGYSGTNFERPAFKEMIEDLKNKIIDTVIVKDLSRLGRDHIQTGYFIETFFPSQNIRFISLMENLDSQLQSDYNDNATFVMACNDYFSKQTSIKIRAILDMKKREGKFVGSQLLFGYMRDPEDKGHLIPNPETAPIVREIFQLALEGKYPNEIAEILNSKGYVTPSKYAGKNGYKREEWKTSLIRNILKNQMYTGDMIQSKSEKVSYKSEKTIPNPKSKWIIVENTHEALVDKKSFFELQNYHQFRNKTVWGREKELLENYIFCKECGNSITFVNLAKRDYCYGDCTTHSRYDKKRQCNSHYVVYKHLENLVFKELEKINIDTSKLNRANISKLIDRIFIDENKTILIVFKKKKLKPISFKYVSRKKKRIV
jgi:DNA invertase Pin-like site-specific DNA recombinase